MKRTILSLTVLVCLLCSASAFAITLEQAKSQGLVGEAPSGYLESVSGLSPEIQGLLTDINSKRKAEYQSIAAKNSTALQAVESLAGKKAIERTIPGNFVKIDGRWVKK